MPFVKATKTQAKLRLAITGPSGSGKTYTALAVGTAIGRVALVDTEHGSAAKYAGSPFDFDTCDLRPPYHPDRFVELLREAESAGYDVVILDSLSHAWNGTGGLLQIVDKIAAGMNSPNTFAAWKTAGPIHQKLIEAIVSSGCHVIATMRSKQEYVIEQEIRNGRNVSVPKKIGLAPIQRDNMEYEFDVVLDMTPENAGVVSKTRCAAIAGRTFPQPGGEFAAILADWLSGAPPVDHAERAAIAADLLMFAEDAYRIPGAPIVFDGPDRVKSWAQFVTAGEYDPAMSGALVTAFRAYVDRVANGVKVSVAAAKAKDEFDRAWNAQDLPPTSLDAVIGPELDALATGFVTDAEND